MLLAYELDIKWTHFVTHAYSFLSNECIFFYYWLNLADIVQDISQSLLNIVRRAHIDADVKSSLTQ